MATWSIEHIPANGGASTFASLGVWGFASLQMQFVNWGIDQAAVTTRGGSIAFEAAQFAYLDKLVVWRNGARFAHFWITGLGTSYQVQESRTYTLSGPAWWLAQYALEDTSNITLYTAGAYIALGMASAIAAGAPVACPASLSAALDIGCPDVRSAGTVLALVQEAARHVPFSSGWWDCSGEIPVLTASRRSAGDSTTLTIGTDPIESFGLTPLPDQQVKSVCIQFGWTGSSSYYLDYAGTDYTESGPNRVQVTLNYATPAAALQASGCGVAAKYYADMAAIPWGGSINLHAAEPADITPIRPGRKVNLAGGLAEWATMDALVQSVVWSVSPETNDLCTLNLGAPDQLGIQEYFDLRAAVGSSAAGESAAEPVSSSDPTPGTIADLNGGDGLGAPPGGQIALQSLGGTGTLCGWPSYVTTNPARFFKTRTLGGAVHFVGHQNGSCSQIWYDADESFSGAAAWAINGAGACARTTQALRTWRTSLGGESSGTEAVDDLGSPGYPDEYTIANTAETQVVTYLGACHDNLNSTSQKRTGSKTATLGSEDDESVVWERIKAGAEWADTPTTAIWTARTTGATFSRRKLRFRTQHQTGTGPGGVPIYAATLNGLAVWQRYRLRIELERQPVNAAGDAIGDWESAGTIYGPGFVTDLSGEGGHDWAAQEIEAERGYQVRMANTSGVEQY